MCEGGKAPLNARGAVPKIKRGMVLLEEGQMVGAEQGSPRLGEGNVWHVTCWRTAVSQ